MIRTTAYTDDLTMSYLRDGFQQWVAKFVDRKTLPLILDAQRCDFTECRRLVEGSVLGVFGFYEGCIEPCDLLSLRWEINRPSCGAIIVSASLGQTLCTNLCTSSSHVEAKARTVEGSKRRYVQVSAT